MVCIVISTFLLKNLFNYLGLNYLTIVKNGVLKDLRKNMFDKIIQLPISYYSEKRKGDVMSRMLGDINEVKNSFFSILELIVKEPMTILFTIGAMIAISFKLTLFVFVFIPISGFVISKIGKSLKSKSSRAQQENGYLISIVEESLGGLKVVKSYNAEKSIISKFNDSINRLLKLSVSIERKNNLASPMSEFMGIVVIAILLWYGGNMVLVEKLATKVYGATTVGPHCRIGGEVNNSVLFGYSNKGHDGFLGNSVLGEWCNIGADSNNSNLKNNYEEVRLWSYETEGFARTGLQFCGLMMGDHSKCGINTMFNTGTVVGVSTNIFGSGFPRNFVPSFSWGGASGFTTYITKKAF
ncbi:MAG: ABC transporter transmembrane domain-containing protein, partial [Flavobacterium sp.]